MIEEGDLVVVEGKEAKLAWFEEGKEKRTRLGVREEEVMKRVRKKG